MSEEVVRYDVDGRRITDRERGQTEAHSGRDHANGEELENESQDNESLRAGGYARGFLLQPTTNEHHGADGLRPNFRDKCTFALGRYARCGAKRLGHEVMYLVENNRSATG